MMLACRVYRPGLALKALQLPTSHHSVRFASTRSKLFQIAEEVEDALHTGKPVVALESTIYTHGFPYPENVALASHLESLVRVHGGVPATIGILGGTAHVGLGTEELIQLVSTAGSKDTWKISRRDLGFIGGLGLRGQKLNGGTTIAGTMILAHLAGIKVFATGGLGGVHRGAENSMDISADLTELGRTPVAVISSGCKSFLDIPRTLEYLETQGVGVGTFVDGRTGAVDFPGFFSRDSGVKSPQVVRDEADAAAIIHAQFQIPVHSGLLLANPVPDEAQIPKEQLDTIIVQAVADADKQGFTGSTNTPFILKRIKELSNGATIGANRALIEANVIRGTKVAVELAKLELTDKQGARLGSGRVQVGVDPHCKSSLTPETKVASKLENSVSENVDLLVVGSLACDTMCDYQPFEKSKHNITPILQTSNPSSISQSVGGVGCNVALAAHYSGTSVGLASVVANDIAGQTLRDQLSKIRVSDSNVRQLNTNNGARTAQYVGVNDQNKDLVLAMADFSIFDSPEMQPTEYWADILSKTQPKWIVLDGNWSAAITCSVLGAAKEQNIPVAFEPVSMAKAARTFHAANKAVTQSTVLPNNAISLTTPNKFELTAMHKAAQDSALFESEQWWLAIDHFGLPSSGARDRFSTMLSTDLVDEGIPQQCVRLLPFVPNIITKLGPKGCLLASVLKAGDEKLNDPASAPYILSRTTVQDSPIGGVYMRLFPPDEQVPQESIVSVNGVGDTLLGVLMTGIITNLKAGQPPHLEKIIPIAQKAAVLTLKSSQSVSPELKSLRSLFST